MTHKVDSASDNLLLFRTLAELLPQYIANQAKLNNLSFSGVRNVVSNGNYCFALDKHNIVLQMTNKD